MSGCDVAASVWTELCAAVSQEKKRQDRVSGGMHRRAVGERGEHAAPPRRERLQRHVFNPQELCTALARAGRIHQSRYSSLSSLGIQNLVCAASVTQFSLISFVLFFSDCRPNCKVTEPRAAKRHVPVGVASVNEEISVILRRLVRFHWTGHGLREGAEGHRTRRRDLMLLWRWFFWGKQ